MKKTKKLISFLLVIFFVINASGCTVLYKAIKGREPLKPVVKSDVNYVKSINETDLFNTMDILKNLSARNSQRIAGTLGEKKAGDYITRVLESYNFKVNKNIFEVKYKSKSPLSLTDEKEDVYYETALNLGSTDKFSEGSYEVMDLGKGDKKVIEASDFKDMIVVLRIGNFDIDSTVNLIESKGAKAILLFSLTSNDIVQGQLKNVSKIPVLSISKTAGVTICEKANNSESYKLKLTDKTIDISGKSKNIIANLDSLDPKKPTIVLGAHYDSTSIYGSNDNASGVASLIKIAEYFSYNKISKYNLVFVLLGSNAAENKGSYEFIKNYDENKFGKINLFINLDTVGIGNKLYIKSTKSSKTTNYLEDLGEGLDFEIKNVKEAIQDAKAFEEKGIDNITITLGDDPNLNTIKDTYQNIKQNTLFKVIDLTINAIKEFDKN